MLMPSVVLAVLTIALTAAPLAAVSLAGLGGTAARVVAGMTEPGSLLVWGTLLAAMARAVGHWRPKA
jgi:hypothetical protein